MYKTLVLAMTTLREMLRERIFFIAILLGFILIILSFLFGALSISEQYKMIADFGLLGIHLAGMGIGLFSGANLIAKEIEKQTCLLMLSRPITRGQFIMGKTLGLSALISMLMLGLTLLVYLLLVVNGKGQFLNLIMIGTELWLQSIVIAFFVVTMSLSVRPSLALGYGIVLFLLGQWFGDLVFLVKKANDKSLEFLLDLVHWVIPNFYKFNWKSWYFLDVGIDVQSFLLMITHYMSWLIIYSLLMNFFFRRKDIV